MSALPTRLVTAMSVEEIGAALAAYPPDHLTLTPGWGAPIDAASNIGVRNVAPPSGDPIVLPPHGTYPQRLHARYYYWTTSTQLQDLYAGGSEQETHVLNAIDVLVSLEPGKTNTYLALFSSRHAPEVLSGPLALMRRAILVLDQGATLKVDESRLGFKRPDLFLWLMTQAREKIDIDKTLKLVKIDAVSGQNTATQVTALSKGVDFDRSGFLVAVADVETLGPARITLKDSTIKARVTFDLWSNGSWALISSDTHYSKLVTDDAVRFRAMQDVAYEMLPKIIEKYDLDDDWRDRRVDEEVVAAAATLVARYTAVGTAASAKIAARDATATGTP